MSQQHNKPDDPPGQSHVNIEMDGNPFSIHRGHQTVAAIKSACSVNPTWVIELIDADGTPQLLDDNGAVTIKGGERFISHVRGGGSS